MTRGRWLFTIFLAGSLTAAAALTYKKWPHILSKRDHQESITASNQVELSSIPPFSTKEPDHYQATRIITSFDGADTAAPKVTRILIARDGDRRREEYETGPSETVVYLETPEGRFVLSPAKKSYADLSLASDGPDKSTTPDDAAAVDHSSGTQTPDFSPEGLLNQTHPLARYEKIGPETINQRATTKYRVTSVDTARGDVTGGTSPASVTLIWIDDELGLALRSETSSTTGDRPSKLTMELRDLKQSVEPRIFELPKDYLKVDYRSLSNEAPQIRETQARQNSGPIKR